MSDSTIGRLCVLVAITMMSIGKVAYGTWLTEVPSSVYTFFCFGMIAAVFLPLFGRRRGKLSWKHLLLLNGSTALCFLFFFYALKLVEPAVAGAVQFGTGPILSVVIMFFVTGIRPASSRLMVCFALLTGCIVLAFSAVTGAGFANDPVNGWIGLVAVVLSALGSVLITLSSKALSQMGWTTGAIIAHRCYLIVPVSLALALGSGAADMAWSPQLVGTLLIVGTVGTILPIVLLQIGLERSTPHTVLVLMAAIPAVTFLFEAFSPSYQWSLVTFVGIMILNVTIVLDIVLERRKKPAAATVV